MSKTINELKNEAEELLQEFNTLKTERDSVMEERVQAAKDAVNAEYGPKLTAIFDKYKPIRDLIDSMKVMDALDGKNAPAPLDKLLIEWRHPSMGRGRMPIPGSKLQPSGRRGRLEVVTAYTKFARNVKFPPAIGSYIIRLVNPKGKLLAETVNLGFLGGNTLPHGWYVEGHNPVVDGERPAPVLKF